MECPIGMRERGQAGVLGGGWGQALLCPSAITSNEHPSLAGSHSYPGLQEAECKQEG